VVVAQAVHSIIRANDALTLRFLNKRAIRHADAASMSLGIAQSGRISPEFSRLRKAVLIPAIDMKSKADYKGVYVGRADAERWIARAERFLEAVENCVGP